MHTHTQQGCAFGVGIMSLAQLKLIQLIRSGRRSTRWGPGGPGGPGREDLRLKPCRYDTNIIRHQVSSGQHVHTFVYMYTRIPIPTCDYMREVYGFVHAIISYPLVLLFARFCQLIAETWDERRADGQINSRGTRFWNVTELGKVPLEILGAWMCSGWILSAGSGKEEGRCGQSIFGGKQLQQSSSSRF